mgnify:FL=1
MGTPTNTEEISKMETTTWAICHYVPSATDEHDRGGRFWQQFQTEEGPRTVYHRLLKVRDSMLANPDICGPAITVYQPVQITEGK